MVKYFGEPLKEIMSKKSGKVMFRFDSKGEFITDDPEIIERANGYFDQMPLKAEPMGDRIAKTIIVPPTTITTLDSKQFKCKHCAFETDSKTELMAHYKTHKEVKDA